MFRLVRSTPSTVAVATTNFSKHCCGAATTSAVMMSSSIRNQSTSTNTTATSSSSKHNPAEQQQQQQQQDARSEAQKQGRMHSYTSAPNASELKDYMSDIQRDEFTQREAIQMNMGQELADPIWNQQHYNEQYGRTKGEMEHFMPKETKKHWMRVVDAAKLLGIGKDRIPGLTLATIEEKFSVVYGNASTASEKDLVTAAAEVLIDYTKSSFAADLSRAKKVQLLHKMKAELDADTKSWHDQIFEKFIHGVSGYVTGAITLTGVAIIGFYVYNKSGNLWSGNGGSGSGSGAEDENSSSDDNPGNATVAKMSRFVRMSVNYDPNMEPAPDYTNRYKNTPTSWDMQKAEGHEEISDPHMRKALQDQDKIAKQELTLMAGLLRDSDNIEKRAKEVRDRGDRRSAEEGEATGPRLLKEMMESRVDAEWWAKAKQLQTLYKESSFVTKW